MYLHAFGDRRDPAGAVRRVRPGGATVPCEQRPKRDRREKGVRQGGRQGGNDSETEGGESGIQKVRSPSPKKPRIQITPPGRTLVSPQG